MLNMNRLINSQTYENSFILCAQTDSLLNKINDPCAFPEAAIHWAIAETLREKRKGR